MSSTLFNINDNVCGDLSDSREILRTAEYVSLRHPDKICDQISDAILDAHLAQDPDARVAVDVAGGHGTIFITGEISSRTQNIDVAKIARRVAGQRANGADYEIISRIAEQSPEIARGVDSGGAGDQGVMIGFATDETRELLPREFQLAKSLNQHLFARWPGDGKTQITTRGRVIQTIVASWQNVARENLVKEIIKWLNKNRLEQPENIFANPAGDWSVGGFDADSGLTGRKLAVDNYGPRVPLGGGAFSGKDPSKVDRSGAYAARQIAREILDQTKRDCREHLNCANKFDGQHEVSVRLAYAIGRANPIEAAAIIDGHARNVTHEYDLTPRGIIKRLNLKRPIYEQLTRDGRFPELPIKS
jgi:S-adenosylmethionine synthetase